MDINYAEFINSIPKFYNDRFIDLTGKTLEVFFYNISDDLRHLYDNDLREIKLQKILKNSDELKRRWTNKVLTGQYNFIDDDMKFVISEYERSKYDEEQLDKFKLYFNVENPDQYRDILISKLNKWRDDKKSRTIDFPYIDSLPKRMCITAYKIDILLKYNDYLTKQDAEKENIAEVPSLFSSLIIDTTNRNTLFDGYEKQDSNEILNSVGDFAPIQQMQVDTDSADRLIMELERDAYLDFYKGEDGKALDNATKIALLKNAKYMNALDIKTFLYYYNNLKNVVSDQPSTMTLYNLEKELGLKDCGTKKTDELILGALSKLANMRLNGSVSGLSNSQISIFGTLLECTFYTKNFQGRQSKFVSVKLGGVLREFLLKKSAYEYNKEIYNSLSADTQQIIIWLQKWRYKSIMCGLELYSEFAIMENSFGIYWRKARLDRKKKRIVAALEELKKNNVIVDRYEVYLKTIKVYYKPVDKNDLRVLSSNGVNISELLGTPLINQ